MRLDIMVDLETLGTESDSTVFQIAAIAFDIDTGEHFGQFNGISDIAKDEILNVTGGTIKWWLNTNKELLAMLLNGGSGSSEELLRSFAKWLKDLTEEYDVYLWGNGILFDNRIIHHQLNALGISYPIFFRNDRDVRTIVELAAKKLNVSEKELRARYKIGNSVAHNAVDDVRFQIRLVHECYKILV